MRSCKMVLGRTGWAELDSGAVSEIGFALGLRKKFCGCGTISEIRETLKGFPSTSGIYFIESSGDNLFRSIREIEI
jgi:hypothetical protein